MDGFNLVSSHGGSGMLTLGEIKDNNALFAG